MEESAHSRDLVRLGFVLAAVSIVAGCLVVGTLQAAYSPLAIALPAGPFEQLERECERLALGAFVLGLVWPKIAAGRPDRAMVRLYGLGATVKTIVLAFAASQGMMAMQASDPRVMAPRLFLVRALANGLLVASFAWAAFLALRRKPTP